MVAPLLDPVVAAKIKLVSAEALFDYIPIKFIPEDLGGRDTYEFEYIKYSDKDKTQVDKPPRFA